MLMSINQLVKGIDAMNLFTYLDEQYAADRKEYEIQRGNSEFVSYLPIEPLDFDANGRFLCAKGQRKTKILFAPDRTRQYFSDADIIAILRDHKNEGIVFSIVEQLVKLYNGSNSKFVFRINNQDFEGYGISIYHDIEEQFSLKTDSTMQLNELVFLMNMIFEKDRNYGQVIHADILKHTLCKYISLVKYYRWHDEKSALFLNKIHYPLNKTIEQLFANKRKSIKLKRLFEKIEDFEKIGVI